jgi:hypothetical protein
VGLAEGLVGGNALLVVLVLVFVEQTPNFHILLRLLMLVLVLVIKLPPLVLLVHPLVCPS